MSRQLRILREARLIRELPVPHDRRGALFGLDPDNLGRIVAWLAGTEIGLGEEMRLRPRKQSLPERLADDWRPRRIGRSITPGGRVAGARRPDHRRLIPPALVVPLGWNEAEGRQRRTEGPCRARSGSGVRGSAAARDGEPT